MLKKLVVKWQFKSRHEPYISNWWDYLHA